MWDDLEWPPPSGCGTQHPHRALGGTCVLLAAAPTTPPCFRHWRRSSSLHFGQIQRKNYFIISEYRSICGRSGIPFSREGFGTNSLSQSLTALPVPSRREPLMRPQALRFSRKLYRHANGSISEDDVPRPGEDVAKRQKGESVERSETGGVQRRAPSPSSLRDATSPKGRGKSTTGSLLFVPNALATDFKPWLSL